MKDRVNIFWFRRDLRLHDNAGLFHALSSGTPVLCIFIYDANILDLLPSRSDRRVDFIVQANHALSESLRRRGSDLLTLRGNPVEALAALLDQYHVDAVYCNEDYEPYARWRDAQVQEMLTKRAVRFYSYKDHCIFAKEEVLKDDGRPYTVFTPYSRKWRSQLNKRHLAPFGSEALARNLYRFRHIARHSVQDLAFRETSLRFRLPEISASALSGYAQSRNLPAADSTSRLGIHLRFGTLSIRQLASQALSFSDTFLSELIWREFFMMILWHFPRVAREAFRPEYNHIRWRNNEMEFKAWQLGRTGYPLVDAGMRQLSQTGFMHNRVRMVCASFLVKHLLIDWHWGEAWFAEKLDDFELSSNNGNWQWAAGSGCDAAPYFRIFNPLVQQKKFDPQLEYIRKWIPEYGTALYPAPIVDHKAARERAIKVYRDSLAVIRRGELF